MRMKGPHDEKGVSHPTIELELCATVRKFSREALVKECMSQVLSVVKIRLGASVVGECVGHILGFVKGERLGNLAASEALCEYRDNPRENREIPWLPKLERTLGRVGKCKDERQ